jgi:hypothetical protein
VPHQPDVAQSALTGREQARGWSYLRPIAVLLALAVLGAALAAMLLPAASVGLYFERSWNEGWNAYQQARAAAGAGLYAADPWRPVNYPFLSFYLVGWLGRLLGNVLLAGRVLNLAGLAAVTASAALFVRRCGGGVPEMLFAAGCALGFQQIQARDWLAVDEPQMLAEAFAMGGLVCYVAGPPRPARLFGTALLFAAGGFVKQIVVTFPAAVTIDLAWRSRRRLVVWILCLAVAAAFFAATSAIVAGGDFLARILEPRLWAWHGVLYHSKKLFFFLKGPVAASILVLCGKLPRGRGVLLRAAGIVALAGGLAFAGGDGVSVNVFLELGVVMGLLAGLALARWHSLFSGASRPRRTTAAIALALPFLFASPILARTTRSLPQLWQLGASWRALEDRQTQFQAAAAWLRGRPGAALCESLLLCFAAGKPLVVDPYGAREQILTGRADEHGLLRAITEHQFAVIAMPEELQPDPRKPDRVRADVLTLQRFTPATLAAIARCYAPTAQSAVALFYVPRRC